MVINIKKIIDYLLSSENRRKNLTVIASLIVFLLILLIGSSNAFYVEDNSIPILNAIIGNFNTENYDIILKIYIENNDKTYTLVDNIPDNEYIYDYYMCGNGSLLNYDDNNKLISILTSEREQCNVYFKPVGGINE